jgi:hypothetical protein
MSNVIQLVTGSRSASIADANGDGAQVVAIAKDRVELAAWSQYAAKLRELEALVKRHRDTLARLPDTPEKSRAINGLAVALEGVQAELNLCAYQLNRPVGASKLSSPPHQ